MKTKTNTSNTSKKVVPVKFASMADALVDANLKNFRAVRQAAKQAVDRQVLADQIALVKGQIEELDRLLAVAGEEPDGVVVLTYTILQVVLVREVGK